MNTPTYIQFQWGGYIHKQDILNKQNKPDVWSAKQEVETSINATFQYPERIKILAIRYED